MTRRRAIIGLSMLGGSMGQLVTLYQTGIISHLLDPPGQQLFDIGLPAGTLADIIDRRRLLFWQGWMLIIAVVLGEPTLLGILTPWLLLTLTFVLSLGASSTGSSGTDGCIH